MSSPSPVDRPQVFLSFAGHDRPTAERLADYLRGHGLRTFLDAQQIPTGGNFVAAINDALGQSRYYVLLWSRHTAARDWVTAEWTAALHREVLERRAFLFVVRLDDSQVPWLLAPRLYLKAHRADELPAVAGALAETWQRDRAERLPVLPAPEPPDTDAVPPDEAMEVYIRNRGLSVLHTVLVPATATGAELRKSAGAELRLPTGVPALADIVNTRFDYEYSVDDRPLTDEPLVDQGVTAHRVIDLLVSVAVLSHGDLVSTWTLRGDPTPREPAPVDSRLPAGLTARTLDTLLAAAFKHLEPS